MMIRNRTALRRGRRRCWLRSPWSAARRRKNPSPSRRRRRRSNRRRCRPNRRRRRAGRRHRHHASTSARPRAPTRRSPRRRRPSRRRTRSSSRSPPTAPRANAEVGRASCVYQDGQTAGEKKQTLNTTGAETTNFEFTNAKPWPAGKYKVEVTRRTARRRRPASSRSSNSSLSPTSWWASMGAVLCRALFLCAAVAYRALIARSGNSPST